MLKTKYQRLHVKYYFPKHASSIYCSDFDMVRVLNLAVAVCLQKTSWSEAAEGLEPGRDPAMWLNTTHYTIGTKHESTKH